MSFSDKLTHDDALVTISVPEVRTACLSALTGAGMPEDLALQSAEHLVQADLAGVGSHGSFRAVQYIRQFNDGLLDARARPAFAKAEGGGDLIVGHDCLGIPAMELAAKTVATTAQSTGIGAIGIRDVGHTGRIGAFAETLAYEGMLAIIIGGGGRKKWTQVAPYGGRKAVLPTNPIAIATPGGKKGPVVLDFATGQIAGGWIYAAQATGGMLPEGAIIDKNGAPTRNPDDYFDDGAILPFGGPKGYALGLAAEMIAEAMLGPSTTECQWLMIALDTSRYRNASALQDAAEDVLVELRECPPASGFESVEIPGERERNHAARTRETGIVMPMKIWAQIVALGQTPE